MSPVVWTLLLLVPLLFGGASFLAGAPAPASTHRSIGPLSATFADVAPIPDGSAIIPIPASQSETVAFTLAGTNPAGLNAFLSSVEDPTSPEYRHYLTEREYESTYAPTASEVNDVVSQLALMGAQQVSVLPDRVGISATLSAGAVDRLFDTDLVSIDGTDGLRTYSATPFPTLPRALQGVVESVGGLGGPASTLGTDLHVLAKSEVGASTPQFVLDPVGGASWYIGSDYTQLYGSSQFFPGTSNPNATFAGHEAVATLLASSFNVSEGVNLPPWDPAVIQQYFANTFPSNWPEPNFTGVPVAVDGVTPPAPGDLGSLQDDLGFEMENSLDLEMAGSMAPGAAIYNFYIPGSVVNGSTVGSQIADAMAQGLGNALAYDYGNDTLAAISISFGVTDLSDTLWNAELEHAAAIGVTIVAASGDQGNAPDGLARAPMGQWPVWPASAAFDAFGAVAAGGVSLSVTGTPAQDSNGTATFDANVGSIDNQTAWYDTDGGPSELAGSEGGISWISGEPDWQFHSAAQPPIVNAAVAQGISSLGRAEPDVAFVANTTIIYDLRNASGTYMEVVEGTSIAAPVFAGLLAELSAVSHHTFGYLDPELYRIGSYFAAYPGPADPFMDVTRGGNYVFSAGPGWDAVTGWGGLRPGLFLAADGNATIRNYTYAGPTPGLPVSSEFGAIPLDDVLLILVVAIVLAVALIAALVRPRRSVPTVPPGAFGSTAALPGTALPGSGETPYASMQCPYCGGLRASDASACPYCGRI